MELEQKLETVEDDAREYIDESLKSIEKMFKEKLQQERDSYSNSLQGDKNSVTNTI